MPPLERRRGQAIRNGGRRELRCAIVTVYRVGVPNSGTTPALPSQGPRLSDLLEVRVHRDATHHWAEARLPAAIKANAALLVATHIARERCGGAPQYFDAWLARHGGGPPHPPGLRQSSFRHITRIPRHATPYAWA